MGRVLHLSEGLQVVLRQSGRSDLADLAGLIASDAREAWEALTACRDGVELAFLESVVEDLRDLGPRDPAQRQAVHQIALKIGGAMAERFP